MNLLCWLFGHKLRQCVLLSGPNHVLVPLGQWYTNHEYCRRCGWDWANANAEVLGLK